MPVGGFPTEYNPQSGVFNQVAAEYLAREVDLTVVHFRYFKPGRKLIDRKSFEGYKYIVVSVPTIPSLHKNWSWLHFQLYAFWIKKSLHKELSKADLVHCVQGEIGVWFSKIKKGYPWKLTTQFIGTDLVSELKEHRKKPWIRGWEEQLDGASFNSQMLKELFLTYYPNFQGALKTIYRGVNLQRFSANGARKELFTFLFIGGLANYHVGEGRNLKGGIDLLKAWSELSRAGKVDAIQLWFGGVDAVEDVIYDITPLENLQNFKAMGPLTKDEVLAAYQACQVVLVPSLQDGLPNVSVEAQACGKPVIGSKVGGIPESVVDGKTGLLFEAGDTKHLSETILAISQNANLYHELSSSARNHVRQNFNAENFGGAYFNFFKEVCAE